MVSVFGVGVRTNVNVQKLKISVCRDCSTRAQQFLVFLALVFSCLRFWYRFGGNLGF